MGVKEIYVIYESKRKLCTKHVRIRVYFCDVLKSNNTNIYIKNMRCDIIRKNILRHVQYINMHIYK